MDPIAMTEEVDILLEMCRLCMKQDETVVHELNGVSHLVKNIAQVDIPLEEGLPCFVCDDCVERLEIANNMRDTCLRSLEYFNKVEETKVEIEVSQEEEQDDEYGVSILEFVRCCICDELYEEIEQLEKHCRDDHERGLTTVTEEISCYVCCNDFESKEAMQSHRTCNLCLMAFVASDDMARHLLEHKFKREESEYEEDEVEEYLVESADLGAAFNAETTNVRSTKLQGCCRCAAQFKKADDLLSHFQEQHTAHIYRGDRGKFNCKWCRAPFEHKGDLQRHYRSPRVKTYNCKECNSFFPTFARLRTHLETKHGGAQLYQCDECDKTYEQLNSLRYHKYTMHNEKNRYKCPDCDKVFTRRNMFTEHRNIHLGLRPFSCRDCGASFASNSSLRSHFRVHTGEKPFSCQYCDKAYSHYSDMKRHSYTHSGNYPHKCEVCQKQFGKKSAYKMHMSMHTAGGTEVGTE